MISLEIPPRDLRHTLFYSITAVICLEKMPENEQCRELDLAQNYGKR